MLRNCVLALALVVGALGPVSDAQARLETVRFTHGNATGVTAFRIYLRQSGQSYGAPAWQGLPTPVAGVYSAQVTVPDGVTVYATGSAINASGESALSNELALPAPPPACGNGSLESPEQCDDGNTASGDGCSASCQVERVPACGDAILDAGEQCDDGNLTSGDGCRANCTRELCGDAIRDASEQCDDGNTANGDGCSASCRVERVPACGDAILDAGEQCDDGNLTSGDGCRSDCTRELCGDARLDAGEQCDEGNLTNGDRCRAKCTHEV
jgi:cysteine-rich repeat protein